MCKTDLRKIAKDALKIRLKNKTRLNDSFCVVDLAENLGIEVKFVSIKSMEGAYFKDSKTILLSTHRPEGRIRFTCAHELGHYQYKHGDHFDELVEKTYNGEDKIAESICDRFASFLLMPETTISYGFKARGWDLSSPKPIQVYTIAAWLGVGYVTLLNHMCFSLRLIDTNTYKALAKKQPLKIKEEETGLHHPSNLIVLDQFWTGRPIDLQVDDSILIKPKFSIEGTCIQLTDNSKTTIVKALKPGLARIILDDYNWNYVVRVRAKDYFGRAKFRHFEEE